MKPRIIIVGGTAAGPSAAAKAKRINPNAEVVLYEAGEHISTGICEVPYLVGGVVPDADELIHFTPSMFEKKKGVMVRTYHLVEEVQPSRKSLVIRDLSKGRTFTERYDKLVLCTGSKSRRLEIPGEDGRNVFRVKSIEEGKAIGKYLSEFAPRRGVIVGGGYIGMEMAEALVRRGLHVTIVHGDERPMEGLERAARDAVREELKRNGVEFRGRSEVRSFTADSSGTVTSVNTSRGMVETDLVILSLGVYPNTTLAKGARIRVGTFDGIVTDERQLTSVDSVYAAGDCCETKNVVHNRSMYLPLATYASRQGRVAGANAAGRKEVFKGAIRAMAVKVFELELAQVGISEGEAVESGLHVEVEAIECDSRASGFPGNSRLHVVAIVERRSQRLLGANVFGRDGVVARANVLGFAIQQRLSLRELASLDLIYAPPFAPLWDPVLILGNKARRGLHDI
ncbi:MAG: NADH oxidase [Ignavibacteria bacterium]|nr:NADH oxidase [Ignavibacteria bacterium]